MKHSIRCTGNLRQRASFQMVNDDIIDPNKKYIYMHSSRQVHSEMYFNQSHRPSVPAFTAVPFRPPGVGHGRPPNFQERLRVGRHRIGDNRPMLPPPFVSYRSSLEHEWMRWLQQPREPFPTLYRSPLFDPVWMPLDYQRPKPKKPCSKPPPQKQQQQQQQQQQLQTPEQTPPQQEFKKKPPPGIIPLRPVLHDWIESAMKQKMTENGGEPEKKSRKDDTSMTEIIQSNPYVPGPMYFNISTFEFNENELKK